MPNNCHQITVHTAVTNTSNNQSHNHPHRPLPVLTALTTLLFLYTPGSDLRKQKQNLSPHHVCLFADGRGCMCPVRCLLASAEICQKGDFPETPHSRTHNQQRRYQQHRSTKNKRRRGWRRSVRCSSEFCQLGRLIKLGKQVKVRWLHTFSKSISFC